MTKREEDQRLIDATNLLCEFAEKNLPTGWRIDILMEPGECSSSLTDQYGNEHEYDPDRCTIRDMCRSAHDIEKERIENPRCEHCGEQTDIESQSGMGGKVTSTKFKCCCCGRTETKEA